MRQFSKGIKTTRITNSCEEEEDEGVRENHRCSRQTHTRCWFVWFFSWLVFKIKKKRPQHGGKVVGGMSLVM